MQTSCESLRKQSSQIILKYILSNFPPNMGNYNTKNEQTVVAAHAEVSQQVDQFKVQMELYGAVIITVTIFVILIILCSCCTRCNKHFGKWFGKQLSTSLNQALTVHHHQQLTSVRTEQLPVPITTTTSSSIPTKVILT